MPHCHQNPKCLLHVEVLALSPGAMGEARRPVHAQGSVTSSCVPKSFRSCSVSRGSWRRFGLQ